MVGIGTLIDVSLTFTGGICGILFGRFMTKHLQDSLMKSTAVAVIFIGLAGALSGMLSIVDGKLVSGQTAMIVISLVLGSLVGELLNIEFQVERFGEWLKYSTGSNGDSTFVNGFVAASLATSIGAMGVVGAVRDGVGGDWSMLALKGAIDALLVCTMTVSMGKGCLFAIIPILIIEGSLTCLARLIEPILIPAAIANLSLVGSILIFCVGINLIWEHTFRVANYMPAMLFAVIAAFL